MGDIENLIIKVNLFRFKQKLYKKLNINIFEQDDDVDDYEVHTLCKIRNVEHKPTGTMVCVDSVLKNYEYLKLKGPKVSLLKKNFDPLLLTTSDMGERLIRQTLDVVRNFSRPIFARNIQFETFDFDFNERLF